MSLLHAMLLGLIQGITEYLPLSANAHVIILGNLLGEPPELCRTLAIALQLAPTLAVLVLYHRRFESLFKPSDGGAFRGARAWKLMALGCLPVLVVGFLFKKYFYSLMLGPWPSVAGLGVGGLGILYVESRYRGGRAASVDEISPSQALFIGLFQCLALWPGISRSGATIIAGLYFGLGRRAAAEFSFLVGVPAFIAAAALEFHKSELLRAHMAEYGAAFIVSFGMALLTVKLFMAFLGKTSFKPFGWYRLALCPLLWKLF